MTTNEFLSFSKSFGEIKDISRRQAIHVLCDHVEHRRPLSLVRFGEGEGRLLAVRSGDDASFSIARNKIRRQTGQKLSKDDIMKLKEKIVLAFNNADVVGIRGDRSFNEEHLSWVRVIEAEFDARVRTGRKSAYVTHCLVNNELSDALSQLFTLQRCVSAISCRNLQPVLMGRYGLDDVQIYQTPSQFVKRGVDDPYEAALHGTPMWPHFIQQLEDRIVVREPGELFLVGVGLFGKHLCVKIKEMGGIAVDLGSRLDFLVGKITRGESKKAIDE